MNVRNIRLLVITLIVGLFAAPVLADVALTTKVQKRVLESSSQGTVQERFVPAEKVVPGDIVAYTIEATNGSTEPAERVVITDPIPEHMRYVEGSGLAKDATLLFSIDGGFRFDHGPHYITRETLFHEYAHHVMHRDEDADYPQWYDEGMSSYLSTVRVRDDAVIIGAAPAQRLAALTDNSLLPLTDLLDPSRRERLHVGPFYFSSWVFVHYLNATSHELLDVSPSLNPSELLLCFDDRSTEPANHHRSALPPLRIPRIRADAAVQVLSFRLASKTIPRRS